MNVTSSLVLTTINDGDVLFSYYENFKKFNRLEQVFVFVIPDIKTPKEVYKKCEILSKKGLKIKCPSLDEQNSFLKKIGFTPSFIPYNSDNRRNVGYLLALESGTDFIISIDDDNYCLNNIDFFKEHSVVCKKENFDKVIDTTTHWYNACSLLGLDKQVTIYPRGFPYFARNQTAKLKLVNNKKVEVHINAGLWLKDPDVDALSWLVNPTYVRDFRRKSYVLDKKCWCPINTQNTSLHRDVVASYYFLKMGYNINGMIIDRYGDIFSGYFSQLCAKHLNKYIRFGSPVVKHIRNSHNYMFDVTKEIGCIIILEDLLLKLQQDVKLQGSNYIETYICLSYILEDLIEKLKGKIWQKDTRYYFHVIANYMRKWANVCKRLG